MSFETLQLHSDILKAINICKYTKPTPIQSLAIPEVLKGRDIVASAPTGTGKTAAFILPALQHLSTKVGAPLKKEGGAKAKPRVLILTPTRELARQITQAAQQYSQFLKLKSATGQLWKLKSANLVGGMPYKQQLRDLSGPVDIIIATPGRLLDHLDNGRINLSAVEILILDEADRMLDMGFIDDVREIANSTPKGRQTLLFSATIDQKLGGIVRDLLRDPARIDTTTEKLAPVKIDQKIFIADNNQHKTKLFQTYLTMENIFKAIIFSGTKMNADKIATSLRTLGYKAAALHGDLSQNKRNKAIDQLRYGKVQFLVATDVAARGIDVSDISHVINYDLPRFSEDYVHRIGRTGRAGKSGVAISFALPSDLRALQKIERFTTQEIIRDTIIGLEPSKTTMEVRPTNKKSKSFKHKKTSGKRESYKKTNAKHFYKERQLERSA